MQISKKSVIAAFVVQDYQEDVYEKFQVNSTYGFAGEAFRSSQPVIVPPSDGLG